MLLDKIFKHNKQPVEMYCGNMIEKAESVNANLEESEILGKLIINIRSFFGCFFGGIGYNKNCK